MKSVFWKMFMVFAGILVVSFLVMAGFFYVELDDFTFDRKIELYDVIAGEIYLNIAGSTFDMSTVPRTYQELEERNLLAENVRVYGENINSIIWVVNENGGIIAISDSTAVDEKFFVRDFYNRTEQYMYEDKYYKPYFESDETTFMATEVFADIYEGSSQKPGLTYIKTYKYTGNDYNSRDLEIAVYIHTPDEELTVARRELILAYLVPWMISITIAAGFIMILAKSFSKPLKNMVGTTNRISRGDLKARVSKLTRKDEIGQLGKALNKMLDKIEELENSRQEFVSDVSHELRTPVTSINGFVEGMLDGTIPPDKQRRYLEIVKIESSRLNRLVNDLMVLTRLSGERNKPVRENFDLNELIRTVVISMESRISSRNIDIDINFEDEITIVNASRDDIERVIVNLLDNAVKFTPENGKISITTKARKSKIMVGIKDNGVGIPAERLEKIWERFYKEDASRGYTSGGAGLGLSIVRSILDSLGESIEVESIEGKGTEFIFSIQQGF
ncbi:MAG: HAMP domain-containing histidine kinase [Clostridia bacterium]|nr:HAMP domain-containing histidine kinase [Clostridia bacterium]MBN2882447.1 HAMP domain-containing histidine kinase [Clostridia bacterium]